jgi:hypothetical protein
MAKASKALSADTDVLEFKGEKDANHGKNKTVN